MYGSFSSRKRWRASAAEISSRSHARPSSSSRSDLALDPLESVLADRLGELEVVVEAVLDRRPDRDLHAGIEPADRLGEQVRGRVPEHGERVRVVLVARRQDLDRLPVRERRAQVLDGPVHPDEHGLLGELRPDRARGVEAGRAVGKFEFAGVGEEHLHERAGYSAGRGRAPRDDDRNEVEGTPVPDPEEEQGDAEDVPEAD